MTPGNRTLQISGGCGATVTAVSRAYSAAGRPVTGGSGQGFCGYDPFMGQLTIPAAETASPASGDISLGGVGWRYAKYGTLRGKWIRRSRGARYGSGYAEMTGSVRRGAGLRGRLPGWHRRATFSAVMSAPGAVSNVSAYGPYWSRRFR